MVEFVVVLRVVLGLVLVVSTTLGLLGAICSAKGIAESRDEVARVVETQGPFVLIFSVLLVFFVGDFGVLLGF